jgi:hypothetical protein
MEGEMRMEKSEKKMPDKCLICVATPVEPSTEGVGASYALCAWHLAPLHDTPAQRARLRQVQADLMTRKVVVMTDANGVGWFRYVPPEAPKPRPPITLDDGSLRYRDWDNSAFIGDAGDDTD